MFVIVAIGQGDTMTDMETALSRIVDPIAKCSLYYERAELKFYDWEIDAAISDYRTALKLSQKQGDNLMASKCLSSLGACYQDLSIPDSALIYSDRALNIIRKDTTKAAMVQKSAIHYQYGIIYGDGLSNSKKSLAHFITSYKLAQKAGDIAQEVDAYLGLAMIYSRFDHDKCIRYGKEAVKKAKQGGTAFQVAEANRFMANSYVLNFNDPENLAQAQKLLGGSISYYKKNQSLFELADCYGCLGKYYFKTTKLDSALYYNRISYDLFSELEVGSAVITAAFDLVKVLYKKGDYKQGLAILEQYVNASEVKEDDEMLQTFLMLSAKGYEKAGQFKKAFYAAQEYKVVSDRYFQKNWDEDAHLLQVKFNADWLEKNSGILKEQNKNLQSRNFLFFWLGLLFLLLWVGGVLSYIKLKKKNNLIEDQKQELEQLNATKSRLFSIIAHDLRAPLIALGGLTRKFNYLLAKNRVEDIRTLGTKVESSLDEVQHLTDNLLSWALVEQGRFPHHPEVVNVAEIVDDCLRLYQTVAAVKKIKLKAEVPENLNIFVDRNTIITVLRNLIDNGIKFTKESGTVSIEARKEEPNVVIQIRDTGIGMDRSLLDSLFSLEKEISCLGTNGEKGSGLGLVLCKDLIERNNGQILVESVVDEGTVFYIYLPI